MKDQLYIEKIDELFSRSRKYYKDFFYERSIGKKIKCNDIIGDQLNSYQTYNTIHKWFKNELVEKFSTDETHYIKFCTGVFQRQFKFISDFRSAMRIFVEDDDLTNTYLKRYNGIDSRELKEEELLLAIQLSYVLAYSALESIVDEFAFLYQRLMPTKDINFSYESESNHIRLGYGVSNNTALELIYQALNPTYVDNTPYEFKAHFEHGEPNKKIKFVGSNANLINLFFGIELLDLPGIKILNGSMLNTILAHFENANGASFDYKSLESQSQKVVKTPRQFEKMKSLLLKLKRLE